MNAFNVVIDVMRELAGYLDVNSVSDMGKFTADEGVEFIFEEHVEDVQVLVEVRRVNRF